MRDLLRQFPFGIAIGLLLALLWAWEQRRKRARGPVPILEGDPGFAKAVARARATVDLMRSLYQGPESGMAVKYPVTTDEGTVEHVWGYLLELTDDSMTVSLETAPVARFKATPPFRVPLAELEDWQLLLPDGAVRGGFTTQYQIELTRSRGMPIPAHLLGMQERFVDR